MYTVIIHFDTVDLVRFFIFIIIIYKNNYRKKKNTEKKKKNHIQEMFGPYFSNETFRF